MNRRTRARPNPHPARFCFDLSSEEEVRAAQVHERSIVFDMMSQHAGSNIFEYYPDELREQWISKFTAGGSSALDLAEMIYWPYEQSRAGTSDLIKDWMLKGGLTCGTFGVDVHDGRDPILNRWDWLVARYADLPWLKYVTTAGEIRQAKRDGVVAFYGHCQPTTEPPDDLAAFDSAYARGMKSFMLTYNRMNNIGVGCTERVDAGLSMFGVDVVRCCNDLGVMVDVSHCGRLTTLDACRMSSAPVNANHTSARGFYEHARGKSDDELRAIADTGGVIGVVAVPFFLSGDADPTIEAMLNHIDYIARLVGPQSIALGTDWPLQIPDATIDRTFGVEASKMGFRRQDNVKPTQRLAGFDDCRDLPNITRGLVSRGYSDGQIEGILGENALRVFSTICG